MTDTSDEQRPAQACVLHRPPDEGQHWWPADESYRTCSSCLDRLRAALRDVVKRYHQLNPRPGATGDGTRGAPGFGSRSPGSDHVISMRDRRSSPTAKAWIAADGKVHLEQERPPLNPHSVLEVEAFDVAETRGITPPDAATLDDLVRWLDAQLDYVTRNADLVTSLDRTVRTVLSQLKPATGDRKPAKIGECPNVLDKGDTTEVCGHPLYAPGGASETIHCLGCHRRWERSEWLRLGDLMAAS